MIFLYRLFRMTPVPDSLIAMAMQYGQTSSTLDNRVQSGLMTPFSGTMSTINSGLLTPGWKTGIQTGVSSTDLDLRKIGQARNLIMDVRLNQVK